MSPHRLRGVADVYEEVISDLRSHDPLVSLLPDKMAIYSGWPNQLGDRNVGVAVSNVWDTSTHQNANTQRTCRVQIAVVSTEAWRKDRTDPVIDQTEILDRAADRLSVGCQISGVTPRGAGIGGGGELEDVDGEGKRITVLSDWRLSWTQSRR